MMYGYGGAFSGWIPMLLWLVIIVCVVFLIIYFIDRNNARHDSRNSKSSAEEILRERYARGEIDTETFLEMKKRLKEK